MRTGRPAASRQTASTGEDLSGLRAVMVHQETFPPVVGQQVVCQTPYSHTVNPLAQQAFGVWALCCYCAAAITKNGQRWAASPKDHQRGPLILFGFSWCGRVSDGI